MRPTACCSKLPDHVSSFTPDNKKITPRTSSDIKEFLVSSQTKNMSYLTFSQGDGCKCRQLDALRVRSRTPTDGKNALWPQASIFPACPWLDQWKYPLGRNAPSMFVRERAHAPVKPTSLRVRISTAPPINPHRDSTQQPAASSLAYQTSSDCEPNRHV